VLSLSITHTPPTHLHRPHVNLWLVAVVVLAAVLVGLGTWVLVDRYAGGSGATQDAATLIDGSNAAISNADAAALASFYAPNAVITRDDGGVTAGAEAIRGLVPMTQSLDYKVWRVAPVSVEGDFATTFLQYTSTMGEGTEPAVYQLREGKILRMWFFKLGDTPPFDNAVMP
jgi:ketosteroid isomerase-like protein